MKIEEKIKDNFLYSKNLNLFKLLYFFFQYLKNKFYPRIIYSNWGADMIVLNIFKKKKDGVYIDVGCHHPFINNNTYILHKKGWRGINVDLDYNSIDMFNFFRPKDNNIKMALSDKKDKANLYFFHNRAAKNTISKKNSKGAKLIKRIQTNTLDNIIKESDLKINEIDFLSIDVEGNELKVLKGLNFKKYKPKVVMIEFINPKSKEFYNNSISQITNSEIYKFMIRKKYKFVNWVQDDLIFIKNNTKSIK